MHLRAAENKEYALTVPNAESEVQAARRQLEQVLASAGFSSNERLARFLRFVVEEHLQGRDGDIKESVIAVEVFGRRPDHDPKHDSIVRTEATRLRARLREYYVGEGKDDEWIIGLPKGGYSPVFLHLSTELASTSDKPAAPVGQRWPARTRFLAVVAGLAIVALAIVSWVWIRRQNVPITVAV